ncbi:aspartate dehydrogenase [Achromobacter veterisilvae]|jgi:aspartate dehydrogenase|uniref:L-aspartate dehydrogenase n=1 Tax=Achromobacter veterisilvae TaxID=2069367 RepID=A0ABZ2S986_9BURK|nr:aspartate dehydrogenase [Achromobacter sp.]MCW0211016.1 aspartate dehydrogenase [Achromobacter sp.]
MSSREELGVAIAGLGAIGKVLAHRLARNEVAGCRLSAVSGRTPEKTADFIASLPRPVPALPLHELPQHADIVVECAPAAVLPQIVGPVLDAGKKVIVLSVGALLEFPDLFLQAEASDGQILVPTGALLGLDAVTAAAEGSIESVKMVSRKPPIGFKGAPILAERNLNIDGLTEPMLLYSGSARAAARGFPANLNVAVALSLAGIGPDETQLEVWADPGVVRNTHTIEVVSDAALLRMTIENIPSENPKTGRITAQSVLALLRKLSAPVRVGT